MPGPPCGSLLDYKTAKFSLTRNRRVGLLHRLLQLSALGYLLGWVLLLRKGYQERDTAPRVAVVTKVKGAAVAEAADRRLWDAADLTWPPQGENVLFLVTNFIATVQQVQGTCPESPSVLDGMCTEDADCPMGNPVVHGNGIKTGKCLIFNATHSTCEIYGWCPVENSTLPRKPLLAETENFTLFIKNTVHFTKFNFSKCNTLQTSDPSYFKSCTYDPIFNPSCPVFRVRDMVEAAGENFGDLALLGGSIRILIEWNCDLDHSATQCQPQYSFSLQDMRYNFRTASYYWGSQQQLYRNLLKLYGIRFDLSVHGQAGKFSIVPTAVSFGTSIAFFGAATMVCDLVLLYLDAKADLYWKEKFEEVHVLSMIAFWEFTAIVNQGVTARPVQTRRDQESWQPCLRQGPLKVSLRPQLRDIGNAPPQTPFPPEPPAGSWPTAAALVEVGQSWPGGHCWGSGLPFLQKHWQQQQFLAPGAQSHPRGSSQR